MHLLEALGADITNKSGNRIGISMKGHEIAVTHGHHSLSKDEVIRIKKFLIDRGIDPVIQSEQA